MTASVIELIRLIPAFPFAGAVFLILLGRRMPRHVIAGVGTGSVGLSALAGIAVAIEFISSPPAGYAFYKTLWRWMQVGGLSPSVALYLDPLSLIMLLVVTIVGFLIHIYSTEFMEGDEGYSRFFAYMNLFVGAMLVLVLADDLLLLYLGWEGVGLCSYLLIGFWYRDPVNGYAARKAFVITRIGDTAMAVGLFLLFTEYGTLRIQDVLMSVEAGTSGGLTISAAAGLLLAGAVGKSAQLPLQTWLPDAMAGPTPVSALIHAATMVTAGVYLIARMHTLFELAPAVQTAVAVIGAATLLVSAASALAQRDIKRVLAYSTMSQIGYMFLALGAGAWSAAIFHFMTHAFFKALLFLAAGAVIISQHHEHDMFRMGGLRKRLPLTFITFLVGAASLSSLPLITAGFYSKELILGGAWSSAKGGPWLWAAGIIGALLTSVYTFRMVFLTFYGEQKTELSRLPGLRMDIPLVILALFSIAGGFIETPKILGGVDIFSSFMESALPQEVVGHLSGHAELMLLAAASLASISGVFIAYMLFLKTPHASERMVRTRLGGMLRRFMLSGWGFDRLYDTLFMRPFVRLAFVSRGDILDLISKIPATSAAAMNRALSFTQTGKVRWYAFAIGLGAAILIWITIV